MGAIAGTLPPQAIPLLKNFFITPWRVDSSEKRGREGAFTIELFNKVE
jgi:hypothetical protein